MFLKKVATIIFLAMFILPTIQGIAQEVSAPTYTQELEFLSAIGVTDTKIRLDVSVTRGTFCGYVANIITNNQLPQAGSIEAPFADVPRSHSSATAISVLKGAGVVLGSGDANFEPDRAIRSIEALAIVLRAFGYSALIQSSGGYPSGYLMVAQRYKFLDGFNVTNDAELTGGTVVKLLYNALFADYVQYSSFGSGTKLEIGQKDNLEGWMKIYDYKGRVTDNGYTSLIGASQLNVGKFALTTADEVLALYCGKTNVIDLIGKKVRCFVKQNAQGDYQALYIKTEHNEVLRIARDDIVNINLIKGTIDYKNNENEKEKTVTVDPYVSVIKNGVVLQKYENADLIPFMGNIELLFIDGSDDCKVIIVNEYYNLVVDYVQYKEFVIVDKYDSTKNITLKDAYYTMTMNGKPFELADLTKWDVISVFKAPSMVNGREYYQAVVSSKQGSGAVTSLDLENHQVSLDETVYTLSNELATDENVGLKLPLSAKIKVCLDGFGFLAAIMQNDASQEAYAFLLSIDRANSLKDAKIKILDKDGDIKILNVIQKPLVDGYRCADKDSLIERLSTSKSGEVAESNTYRFIKYQLNIDGEIIKIETDSPNFYANSVDSTSDDSSSLQSGVREVGSYSNEIKTFNGNFMLDEKTAIFRVPLYEMRDREDLCKVLPLSDLLEDFAYEYQGFDFANTDIVGALVLYNESGLAPGASTSSLQIHVVIGVKDVFVEDGDIRKKISLFSLDGIVEYMLPEIPPAYVKTLTNKLKKGDAVRLMINEQTKEIAHLERLFMIDQNIKTYTMNYPPAASSARGVNYGDYDIREYYSNDYKGQPSMVYGTAIRTNGSYARLKMVKNSENDYIKFLNGGTVPEEINEKVYNLATGKVILVNVNSEGQTAVNFGSTEDIKTLQSTGNYFEASRILMRVYKGRVYESVIFNFPAEKNSTPLD